MLNENKRGKYSPIDPYMRQTPVKDFQYEEFGNKEIRIFDYSQYDYEKFRDKRQSDKNPPDSSPETDKDPPPFKDDNQKTEDKEYFLIPLYVITGFFAAVMFIGPLLVRKGPNRGIVQSSIMIAAFCMWIFWFTIYFGQMHPLMGPRLENTTVAWIAYKLGNPVINDTS